MNIYQKYFMLLMACLCSQFLLAQDQVTFAVTHNNFPGNNNGSVTVFIQIDDEPQLTEKYYFEWYDENDFLFLDGEGEFMAENLESGEYCIRVTSEDGCVAGGCVTIFDCATGDGLNATFAYLINGLIVEFFDGSNSCGDITGWDWDFGDNNTSNATDPVHIYSAAGTYEVQLTVEDSRGETATTTQLVTVFDSEDLTAIIMGPSEANVGEEVSLISNVTGGNLSPGDEYFYSWEFGEGGSSSDPNAANPDVFYATAGTKTITLEVTDSDGTMAFDQHTIDIGSSLQVDFTWDPETPDQCQTVYFQSDVTGNVGDLTYEWKFGVFDGEGVEYTCGQSFNTGCPAISGSGPCWASTSFNYNEIGGYEVTLTVCDDVTCVTVTKPILVGEGIFANFNWSPTTGEDGMPIYFADQSITSPNIAIVHYDWFIGTEHFAFGAPGDPDDPANPVYNVASTAGSGWSTVRLIVTGDDGSTSQMMKEIYIDGQTIEECFASTQLDGNLCSDEPWIWGDTPDDCGTPGPGDIICVVDGNSLEFENFVYNWVQGEQYLDFSAHPNGAQAPCAKINLDHPDIQAAFADGEPFSFNAKLKIEDGEAYIFLDREVTVFPDLAVDLENITACPNTQVKLGNTPIVTGGDDPYTYTWTRLPGSNELLSPELSCDDCPNPIVTSSPVEEEYYRYKVRIEDDRSEYGLSNGCWKELSVKITTSSLVVEATDDPDNSILACVGSSIATLGATPTATGGSGTYTYNWSPVDYLDNPTIANPVVAAKSPGSTTSYTVTVSDSHGCTGVDEVEVTGSFSTVYADAGIIGDGGIKLYCYDSDIELGSYPTGQGQNLVGDLVYEWSASNPNYDFPPDLINDPNPLIENVANNLHTGAYSVTVTDEGNGCFDISTVTVQVYEEWAYEPIPGKPTPGPILYACAGDDNCDRALANESDPIILFDQGGARYPVTYSWNASAPIIQPDNVINPWFCPTPDYPFAILTITDDVGCIEEYESKMWSLYDISFSLPSAPCAESTVEVEVIIELKNTVEFPVIVLPPTFDLEWQNSDGESGTESFTIGNDGLYRTTLSMQFPNSNGPSQEWVEIQSIDVDGQSLSCANGYGTFEFYLGAPGPLPPSMVVCNNAGGNTYIQPNIYSAVEVYSGTSSCSVIGTVRPNDFVEFVGQRRVIISGDVGFHAQANSHFIAKLGAEDCPGFNDDGVAKLMVNHDPGNRSTASMSVYPNPFSHEIMITYDLENEEAEDVLLRIYHASGSAQYTLTNEKNIGPGSYSFLFNASDLSSGIYVVELVTDSHNIVRRIIKVKD